MRRATAVAGLAVGVLVLVGASQTPPVPPAPAGSGEPPPASQPASQPSGSTYRSPREGEILKRLIQSKEAPVILPEKPGRETGLLGAQRERANPDLLLEGTILSERPGRLVDMEGRPSLELLPTAEFTQTQTMPLLENRLLEALEQQAARGVSEFVVTAEVTRYHDKNYLLLKKVIQRVPNRNLAP